MSDHTNELTAADLRHWRAHWRVSQLELADMLGVNIRTVARWEKGAGGPGGDVPAYLPLALETLERRLAAELTERARGSGLIAPSNAARSLP